MKKVILLVVLLLVMTTAFRALVFGPSTLELRVTLEEGGADVTSQFKHYVGYVPDGKSGPPTLGNIALIKPLTGPANLYEVPPDRNIGIFVLSPGVPPFQSTVYVKSGQHLDHSVVLDAGTVRVTTETIDKIAYPNIWYVDPDGQIDTNATFFDGVEFVVPAGEQTFQFGRFLEAKRESVEVVAGEMHDLNIVSRIGELSISLATAIPLDQSSPTLDISSGNSANALHFRGSDFDAGRWQYGTYYSKFEFRQRGFLPIRPATTSAFEVTIDQPNNSMTISLSFIGIEANFYEWAEEIPAFSEAIVVSVTEPGLPFATYRVTDNRAQLMFLPPKEAHEYAIALVAGKKVLALQNIGSVPADEQQRATVFPGGDFALCERIVLDHDCSALL